MKKLSEMSERRLLFERMKHDRGESDFTNEEINNQAFENMKKLVGKEEDD